MKNREGRGLAIARLGADGRLTIPAEYRRALAPSGPADSTLVQVGDALILAPHDDPFTAVVERLEARMHEAGSSVEELVNAASEARAELARAEFGAEE